MRAVNIKEPGNADVLYIAESELPSMIEDEVLIKVKAAGINRPDIIQRQGNYPPPPGASNTIGLEVAGEIVEVGEQVTTYKPGDRVCALVNGGGYAEYVSAAAAQCLSIPEKFSMIEAAALPETFFTVWANVFEIAQLKSNETFLIHGGSSGIGTTAIQLAKQLGARVFATAGSVEKCQACEALGAERAINYHEEDFVEVLKALTNGKGIDVILDMVGGDYVSRNIKLAAVEGRIISIAFLAGVKAEVNLMPVMLKRLILTGSTLRPRSKEFKAHIASQLKTKIWPLLEEGRVKPVIYKVFPFDEVAEAHRLMESNQHIGKIILEL